MLLDSCADLIDRQLDENEYEALHSTRLVVSAGYASDVVYRGRDAGIQQYSLSPQIAFIHRSGLFAQLAAAWLDHSPTRWDQKSIGAGYEFVAGGLFSGSFSYTHYWFSDSSNQEKSQLTNSLDGDLFFRTRFVTIELSPSLAFATESEFTTTMALSHEFETMSPFRGSILSIAPTAAAMVGQ